MKRRPQGWDERFAASLQSHPSPALEAWRWAREDEEPSDPRAIEAQGRIKGTLKIFTNLKETPVISVPVTYMVRM